MVLSEGTRGNENVNLLRDHLAAHLVDEICCSLSVSTCHGLAMHLGLEGQSRDTLSGATLWRMKSVLSVQVCAAGSEETDQQADPVPQLQASVECAADSHTADAL